MNSRDHIPICDRAENAGEDINSENGLEIANPNPKINEAKSQGTLTFSSSFPTRRVNRYITVRKTNVTIVEITPYYQVFKLSVSLRTHFEACARVRRCYQNVRWQHVPLLKILFYLHNTLAKEDNQYYSQINCQNFSSSQPRLNFFAVSPAFQMFIADSDGLTINCSYLVVTFFVTARFYTFHFAFQLYSGSFGTN
jgi:hypothetical protein